MANKRGCGRGLLGVVLLLGLMGWGINSCVERAQQANRAEVDRRNSLSPEQREEEDRIAAEEHAKSALERKRFSQEVDVRIFSEDSVRKFLHFPDEADFGFWATPEIEVNEAGDKFVATSTVKAKNTFGVQSTHRWKTVVHSSNESYQLVSCTIDDEVVYEDKELLSRLNNRIDPALPLESDNVSEETQIAEEDAAHVDAAKWRTWTTANGNFTVYAKFVKLAQGEVTLEKQDGSVVDVKLDVLSESDQEFVRKRKWLSASPTHNAPRSMGNSKVEILKVRVTPFTTASGLKTQTVVIDWRNGGTKTIRAVDADIILYDAQGHVLDSRNYTIYAVSDSSPGIAPGETYLGPEDKGFIVPADATKADRAEVKVTEVLEHGAF